MNGAPTAAAVAGIVAGIHSGVGIGASNSAASRTAWAFAVVVVAVGRCNRTACSTDWHYIRESLFFPRSYAFWSCRGSGDGNLP